MENRPLGSNRALCQRGEFASAFVPSKEVSHSWRDFRYRNRELFGQVRAISRIAASGRPESRKTCTRVRNIHIHAVRRKGNGLFVFRDRYCSSRGLEVSPPRRCLL